MSSENNKKRKVSFLGLEVLGLDDKKECFLKEEEMRPPVNVASNTFICPPMNTSIRPSVCSPVKQRGKKVKIESEVWFDNKAVDETKKETKKEKVVEDYYWMHYNAN